MTQDENLCKETAKALIGYYSWHLDELLELYNAMGQTHEKDLSNLHLKTERAGAYIWQDRLHTHFIKLSDYSNGNFLTVVVE